MSEQQSLRRIVHRDVAAHDVLAWLVGQGLGGGIAFGMAMAPHRFDLAKVADGVIAFCEAGPSLDAAYEIRLFGRATDARWQRDGATGCLTVLTVDIACRGGAEVATVDRLHRHYRLFGTASRGARDGWSAATSARIRAIQVPVAAAHGSVLHLTAVEHIGRAKHGNAVVVAERLTGIEVAKG